MSEHDLIQKTISEIPDILRRKYRDYGSSFRKAGILAVALDLKSKMLVRIDDKLDQLGNLLASGTDSEVSDDSVADTVNDLIGDFVLLAILLDEEKQNIRPMSVIESETRLENPETGDTA